MRNGVKRALDAIRVWLVVRCDERRKIQVADAPCTRAALARGQDASIDPVVDGAARHAEFSRNLFRRKELSLCARFTHMQLLTLCHTWRHFSMVRSCI
jgi:hypothetical protein